jgi:peptidoglycan hydrolase FlgJ
MDNSLGSIFGNASSNTLPAAMQAVLDVGKKKLSKEEVEKVAGDFESMFLSQMLQALFPEQEESVGAGGDEESLFGSLNGDSAYQGLMADQYAKRIAQAGGIGIAEYVQREMLKHQEVSSVDAATPTTVSTGATL